MGAVLSKFSQFGGAAPSTSAIVNKFSSGGVSATNISTGANGVAVASGSGTANTLATLLSVSGSGFCPYLICYSNSATPTHTIRCQVIVDGVTVFDATSDTITTTADKGMTVVDSIPLSGTYSVPSGVPMRYNSSFVVKACSSQSGTNYVAIRYDLSKT